MDGWMDGSKPSIWYSLIKLKKRMQGHLHIYRMVLWVMVFLGRVVLPLVQTRNHHPAPELTVILITENQASLAD
jgi:hypothetical protein